MKKRLAILASVLALGYLLARHANVRTLWTAALGMPRASLLGLFALLAANALAQALRWAYYLRAAGLRLRWADGVTSYLGGMAAAVLPGGSLLAARLAQEHQGVRMRDATPALFVNVVGDAIALSCLALAFAFVLPVETGHSVLTPLLGLALAVLLVALGRSARLWRLAGRLLARTRYTRNWLPKEEDVRERVAALVRAPVLARGVAFSLLTTLISILTLVVVVNGLTFRGLRLREAATIHVEAEIVGIVAPLSFGIGVKETSLANMLNTLGIGWVRVTFVIVALRTLTILVRTSVGLVVLAVWYRPLLRSLVGARLPRWLQFRSAPAGGQPAHSALPVRSDAAPPNQPPRLE